MIRFDFESSGHGSFMTHSHNVPDVHVEGLLAQILSWTHRFWEDNWRLSGVGGPKHSLLAEARIAINACIKLVRSVLGWPGRCGVSTQVYSHAPIPHVKSQKRNPCQACRIRRQGALGPVLPLGRLWCFAFVRAKRTGLCRGQANVTTGCEGANPGLIAVARIAGSWSFHLCDSSSRPHLGSPGGVSVEILRRSLLLLIQGWERGRGRRGLLTKLELR
jgi:hypothetical protein